MQLKSKAIQCSIHLTLQINDTVHINKVHYRTQPPLPPENNTLLPRRQPHSKKHLKQIETYTQCPCHFTLCTRHHGYKRKMCRTFPQTQNIRGKPKRTVDSKFKSGEEAWKDRHLVKRPRLATAERSSWNGCARCGEGTALWLEPVTSTQRLRRGQTRCFINVTLLL